MPGVTITVPLSKSSHKQQQGGVVRCKAIPAKSEGRMPLISQSSAALYYILTLFSTPVRVSAKVRVGAVSDTQ